MATTACGGQRRIAIAGGHVEHAFVAEQVAGFGQFLADDLQRGTDHGIVAAGPGGHLTVFQGSKINGCTHGDCLWRVGTMDRQRGARLLRRRGVDDVHDLGYAVGRETTLPGMLPDELLIRRDVHAVELVAGDVTLQPLHFRQIAQDFARLLRDGFQIPF
ncbi:hypothetical protein D3C86_1584790 [compost metagenome]